MVKFDEIYKQNCNTMMRIAQKIVNNNNIVPDIVQDVFVDFYKVQNNKTVVLNAKSWLIKATINKSIDYYRKKKKFENTDSLKFLHAEENSIEKKEMKDAIKMALNKLPEREKTLAVLYSEGFSYKEISEVTKIKFTSVGKMLSRTLQKLEKELKHMHYELY